MLSLLYVVSYLALGLPAVIAGFLVVHGGGFEETPGTRHFRVVFLPDEQTLARAYERIASFLQERS